MKITKTKEVVTEEIEIKEGIYYFACCTDTYNKIILSKTNDEGHTDYILEVIENFSDVWSIKCIEDFIYDDDSIPYKFRSLILGISGRKIEKEEFEEQKLEVLNKFK